mmetsp:Transcript_16090/g.50433  ORF Transcript_16090/g.50433 Transcript_16090/m.50433 type:complete len:421 (-) Transcript_16090:729-1991(-)
MLTAVRTLSASSLHAEPWVCERHARSYKNDGSEDGTITCVELSSDGELCGVGDKSGRICVVRTRTGEKVVEFKSHEAEFDYLKSLEIEEKINKIKFCAAGGPRRLLLSTNDKTIKLWKIEEARGRAVAKRVFGNAHAYHINSISLNSDGETFCSADDLRLNVWNLEIAARTFNVVDLKPTHMEDLTEVMTSASFHPRRCFELMLASSKGVCKIFDLRRSARCGQPVACLGAAPAETFFGEIVASVSDAKFIADDVVGARDFLNVRLFDLRNPSAPTHVVAVHDHLKPRLSDLYDADRIFDKFECAGDPSNRRLYTGTYSDACLAVRLDLPPSPDDDDEAKYHLLPPGLPPVGPADKAAPDLDRRVLHLAADDRTLAFAANDTVHFFDLDPAHDSSDSSDSSRHLDSQLPPPLPPRDDDLL